MKEDKGRHSQPVESKELPFSATAYNGQKLDKSINNKVLDQSLPCGSVIGITETSELSGILHQNDNSALLNSEHPHQIYLQGANTQHHLLSQQVYPGNQEQLIYQSELRDPSQRNPQHDTSRAPFSSVVYHG